MYQTRHADLSIGILVPTILIAFALAQIGCASLHTIPPTTTTHCIDIHGIDLRAAQEQARAAIKVVLTSGSSTSAADIVLTSSIPTQDTNLRVCGRTTRSPKLFRSEVKARIHAEILAKLGNPVSQTWWRELPSVSLSPITTSEIDTGYIIVCGSHSQPSKCLVRLSNSVLFARLDGQLVQLVPSEAEVSGMLRAASLHPELLRD